MQSHKIIVMSSLRILMLFWSTMENFSELFSKPIAFIYHIVATDCSQLFFKYTSTMKFINKETLQLINTQPIDKETLQLINTHSIDNTIELMTPIPIIQ